MSNDTSTAGAASAYDYPLIIKHLLHTPLCCTPDREIVYADRHRYDYRTLRERIGRLASALTGLGVKPGDTVAVMDWDSHRYLECFFAVPMLGAVLHHINVRLAPNQIRYTIDHAEDDVLLVHADFLPLLEEFHDRLEHPPRLVLLADESTTPPTALAIECAYEAMLEAADADFEFPEFDERTRATTFYTTGTTGDPKGVWYTHRQLVLHTLGGLAGIGTGGGHGRFHKDDVYMPLTPMFHVHAWGMPYMATLMGVKQVYPGRYEPGAVLDLIERERVTFSHCVPTILHMLLTCPGTEHVDLSRWKVVIGGAAMPAGLAAAARERGIDVLGGYGLSETCPVLTAAQLDADMLNADAERQLYFRCKAGRPLPLVDLRVVDEQMRDLPHDGESTGEVVVRAPWLTPGYVKAPEMTEQLWRGGYLHTGDIGHIDADGYLKITDRLKDVIKSGGEWISSLQLEDLVSRHPGVGEVAAIGIPDEKWGERPMLLVVAKPDYATTLTAEAIRAEIDAAVQRGALPKWAIPDQVKFVPAIEKTSVGKIDKKALRARYGTGLSR